MAWLKNKNRALVYRSMIFIWVVWCGISCNQESGKDSSWKGYYLPIDLLSKADLLYEYRYEGSQDSPFFWYHQLVSDSILVSEQLDPSGEILVENRERLLPDGAILIQQTITERDTITDQRVSTSFDILADDLFSFKPLDSLSVLTNEVLFTSSVYPGQYTTITKKRQFIGDTLVTFKGETYPAIQFRLIEHYDIEEVGHLEFDVLGQETYALGLGLFALKKKLDGGAEIAFILHNYELVEKD